MTEPIIQRLSAYGACDIADALLRLKHPTGGFLSGLVLRGPNQDTKVIGRAHTVLFRRNTIAPQKKNFTGHYIDSVTPGSVLFISSPAIPNAVYGGLMSTRLKKLGGAGAIVDGRVRDLAEHRALGIPLFSRDIGITAGQEVVYPSEINVPVQLRSEGQDDVWIRPGDILVGDENGVACIPRELEEQVVELIPRLMEVDERVRKAIEDGQTAQEAFKLRKV